MSAVYFIRPVGQRGPVKIGCSVNPHLRKSHLEAWSPFELEIAAKIAGDRMTEERFHAYFIDQWHRLEWFHWSARLEGVMTEINAGTFDTDILPRASGPIKSLLARRCKWSDIDYNYYDLWRAYGSRDFHAWMNPFPPTPSLFARMGDEQKAVWIGRISDFMANYAPPSTEKAA